MDCVPVTEELPASAELGAVGGFGWLNQLFELFRWAVAQGKL